MENARNGVWRGRDIFFSFATAFFVIVGVVYSVFSVGAFLMCLLYMSVCALNNRCEKIFFLLLFLLPFACVFKLSPGSTSLYTYIELYGCLLLILKFQNIGKTFLTVFLIYAAYTFYLCGSDITTLVKQCLIPLLAYYFFGNICCDTKSVVMSHTLGLLFSSLFGLFYDKIPNMTYYVELDMAYELEERVYRFSGLYNDPNYYSASMILAFSCLLLLFLTDELRFSAIGLCTLIVLFGAKTVSKSFIIMLAGVYLVFTVMMFVRKKYAYGICFIGGVLVLFALVMSGEISVFDNVLERLDESDLTTGRSELWSEYITYLINNPIRFIFGSGLSAAPIGTHYPHNTYIDFMYFYGIIGTLLFVCVMLAACHTGRKNRKRAENYIPICCMACMLLFLSSVKSFDFAFILIITIYFLELDIPITEEQYGKIR